MAAKSAGAAERGRAGSRERLREVRGGQAQGHAGSGQGPAEGDRRAAQDAVQDRVRAAAQPGDAAADQRPVDPGRGRRDGDQGHRRRGQEVLRRAEEAELPEGRRLPEVPQGLRPDARRTSSSASSSTCCRTRSATRSSRARTQVSDKAIADFYNKNKARFAQPEKRDLRVVLTKAKADADKAQRRARGRRLVEDRRQASTRSTTPPRRPAASSPAQAKGTLDKELDDAVFSRQEGRAGRPGQDPVRLLRLRGRRRHRAEPADARRGQGDDQADARRRRSSRRRWTRS